jgi:predicted phosphodiesterase
MKFAVINDLHAQFAPDSHQPGYPDANRRAEWMLRQFAAGGSLADVDFVIGAGDLIHGEDIASIRAELNALKPHLEKFAVPFYPVCGNHEIRQAEGDPAYEAPYREAYGDDRFDYVIPAGPVEVIVLNNAGAFHVTAPRREARANALRRMLQANPDKPKILVCHIPMVPLRERDVLRRSFGFISYVNLEVELNDLLDEAGAAVPLVISGHLHITGMVERRGVKHLVTSGTASFPHDYAVATVSPAAIEVEVRSLPAELHEPASNIHGPPRYKQGFTDAAHPTHDAYLRGNESERRFTIKL